jgi:hypothetical protein
LIPGSLIVVQSIAETIFGGESWKYRREKGRGDSDGLIQYEN